ncbi:MAG: PDZ domain-containing protein, partial [Planctomycetota bacterium]|nr:PDZ domain-containing protein [Planctomycetota bacterium]
MKRIGISVMILAAAVWAGPEDSLVGVSGRRQMQFNFQGRQMNRAFAVQQAGIVVGKELVLTATLGDDPTNVRVFVPGQATGIEAELVDGDETFTLLKVPGLETKPVTFAEAWAPATGAKITWHGVLAGRIGKWSRVSKTATADAVLDDGRKVYSDPPFRGPVATIGALVTDAQGRAVGIIAMEAPEDQGGGRRGGRGRRMGGGTPFVRPVGAFAHFLTGAVQKKGVLGVEAETLDDQVAEALGLKGTAGVLVTRVTPGSGAAKAGVEAQQVITKVGGKETPNVVALQRALRGQAAGAKVAVEIVGVTVEGIKTRTIEVTLGAPEESDKADRVRAKRFGFIAEPLTAAMRRDRGLPADVLGMSVRRVNPGGPASMARPAPLRRGDVILRVDKTDVPDGEKLKAALKAIENGKTATLFVQRGTET